MGERKDEDPFDKGCVLLDASAAVVLLQLSLINYLSSPPNYQSRSGPVVRTVPTHRWFLAPALPNR